LEQQQPQSKKLKTTSDEENVEENQEVPLCLPCNNVEEFPLCNHDGEEHPDEAAGEPELLYFFDDVEAQERATQQQKVKLRLEQLQALANSQYKEGNRLESTDPMQESVADPTFPPEDESKVYDNFPGLDTNPSLKYFMHSYENSTLNVDTPFDAGKPFVIGAPKGSLPTMGDFCRSLAGVAAQYNISNSALSDVLKTIEMAAPHLLRLPLKQLSSSSDSYALTIDKYLREDFRKFKVHTCIKGCTAYVGRYKRDILCMCGNWRFAPCSHHSHKKLGRTMDEELNERQKCNPFTDGHALVNRVPHQSFYYRAIIPLLKSLIVWELTHKTNTYNYTNDRIQQAGKMYDILDGLHAAENLGDMNARFIKFKEKSGKSDILERSFLLSEFYDGALLHKRKSSSLWPLVISILNCNPSDRMAHGIGLFLVALHSLKLGTNAEQAIFHELFIPELQQLGKGIDCTLQVEGKSVDIFLQARLIVHILDTKALEHVACISGKMNRFAGCY